MLVLISGQQFFLVIRYKQWRGQKGTVDIEQSPSLSWGGETVLLCNSYEDRPYNKEKCDQWGIKSIRKFIQPRFVSLSALVFYFIFQLSYDWHKDQYNQWHKQLRHKNYGTLVAEGSLWDPI